MRNWYEVTVKYAKENEEGLLKKVSEKYILDAVSFTEAEATVYDRLGSVIRGDFTVSGIRKSNIEEVIYDDRVDEGFYKCKVTYFVADELSGREKKVAKYILVTAFDILSAHEVVEESLKNMLVSYRITEIVESPILEAFAYEKE